MGSIWVISSSGIKGNEMIINGPNSDFRRSQNPYSITTAQEVALPYIPSSWLGPKPGLGSISITSLTDTISSNWLLLALGVGAFLWYKTKAKKPRRIKPVVQQVEEKGFSLFS